LLTSGLQWVFYRISSIGDEIVRIENKETAKHLTMFNALRDGILLTRDHSLIFVNSVARSLFTTSAEG